MSSASDTGGGRGLVPALVVFLLLLGGGILLALAGARGTPAEPREKGDEIRSYLLAHPDVVLEAIERWQRSQMADVEREQSRRIGAAWRELAHDGVSPVIGPEDAPVTVIEFYDYRCPYCRRAHADTARLLKEFEGRIRYVFKQFPVLDRPGDPPVSATAARAAVAAFRQGCFPAYHDAVMTASGGLSEERILRLAQEAGCDLDRLKRDMGDPAIEEYIQRTLATAHALGVAGTPTYVVNRRLLEGAGGYARLKNAVKEALAGADAAAG